MSPDAPSAHSPRVSVLASLAIAAAGLVAVAILGVEPRTMPAVAWALITSGLPAAAFVAGAAGLGRLALPLVVGRGTPRDPALAAGLGLALMLSASHALGCLGLLSGGAGRIVAIGLVAIGLAGLVPLRRGQERRRVRLDTGIVIVAPLALIALVAASSPPGWLWNSEFGGYDALSYHLQLPQEWIALGRITPVDHNVYSFLPGAIESTYLHVGVMLGARGPATGMPWGLVAHDGRGVLAAQFLHLWIGVLAVALLARFACRAAERGSPATSGGPRAGSIAACVAGVPWMLVTATLAYNEMGVLALGASAGIVALDDRLSPGRRGALAGLLVGAACLCKPTASLFVGVPVGILLLGLEPPRRWGRMVLAGSVAGVAILAPWLLRNGIACGNPVFPFASGLLGDGWWSREQISRFERAHAFGGSALERLGLLVGAANEPGDVTRGFANLQWGSFAVAPLVLPIIAFLRGGSRRITILLALGLGAQIVAWLTTTHLQSRFLLPTLLTLAPLLGVALRPGGSHRADGLRQAASVLVAACNVAACLAVFGAQRGGRPGALVALGPAIYSGEHETTLAEEASAEVTINLAYPGRRVFLLGDSTPLYFSTPPQYATTWDSSALTRAIAERPDQPDAWIAALRDAGADLVLINLAELDRLRGSGWLDPALTEERIRELGARLAPPVQSWPRTGRYLFDLSRSHP